MCFKLDKHEWADIISCIIYLTSILLVRYNAYFGRLWYIFCPFNSSCWPSTQHCRSLAFHVTLKNFLPLMWSHANSLFCAVIIQPPLCTTSTWVIRKDISNVQMYFWNHSKNSHVLGSSSLDWQNSLWVCFKKWDVLCCSYKDLDCNHLCVFSQEPVDYEGSRDEVGCPTQNPQNEVWKARELRECICFFRPAADVLIFPFIKNVQPCVGNVLLLICQTSKHWHV